MDICDTCCNLMYDEYEEYYTCVANLDEDEMARFISQKYKECLIIKVMMSIK